MINRKEERRIEILEACYDCFCKNGLENTNIKKLAEACNMSTANLFTYFKNKDEIIVQSTQHCMVKIEEDFLQLSPAGINDLHRFIHEMPRWTAEKHGEKYRFMYQMCSSPQYRQYGNIFIGGITKRYTEYAKQFEPLLGIPWQDLQGLLFLFIRSCVHYAMFGDETYLNSELAVLEKCIYLLKENQR